MKLACILMLCQLTCSCVLFRGTPHKDAYTFIEHLRGKHHTAELAKKSGARHAAEVCESLDQHARIVDISEYRPYIIFGKPTLIEIKFLCE